MNEAMILGGKVIVATRAIIIRATDRNPHPLPRAPAAVGGWQTRAGGNGAGHLVRAGRVRSSSAKKHDPEVDFTRLDLRV